MKKLAPVAYAALALLIAGTLAWHQYWPVSALVPSEIVLYPALSWQESKPTEYLEVYFNDNRILIPNSAEAKVFKAVVLHNPPIDIESDDRTAYSVYARDVEHFHSYFKTEMLMRGFTNEDIEVPGGYLDHFTAEKVTTVSDHYGRVRDGMYQRVIVQSYSEDSADYCEVPKNIFDGCNVIVAEHYEVTISEPYPLADLLNEPLRGNQEPPPAL